jgi:hypothetical protein
VPDELEALWVELGESWNDDGAHDRFCDAAVRVGAYAYAARCYRRALPQPDREEVARQRLEKVARMAEAHLISVANVARGRETESEPYRGVVILLIVLVLLLGIGGVYLVFRSSAQTDGSNRFQRAPADVEARVLRASALR